MFRSFWRTGSRRLAALSVVFTGYATAQSGLQVERIRARMSVSLSRQQASVNRQVALQQKRRSGGQANGSIVEVVAPPIQVSRPECDRLSPETISSHVDEAAAQQGLSPDFLRAVAHVESGFVPCAVSAKGAAGLMQIMPATGRDLGLVNPWDPQQSLAAGAKYLRQLLDRYGGNVRLALGAYNAGPARVDQYGDVPPIDETQSYVRRILLELGTGTPFGDVTPILDK